jgi:hypothetical protein
MSNPHNIRKNLIIVHGKKISPHRQHLGIKTWIANNVSSLSKLQTLSPSLQTKIQTNCKQKSILSNRANEKKYQLKKIVRKK